LSKAEGGSLLNLMRVSCNLLVDESSLRCNPSEDQEQEIHEDLFL